MSKLTYHSPAYFGKAELSILSFGQTKHCYFSQHTDAVLAYFITPVQCQNPSKLFMQS